jgi:hypothetical protein
MRQCQNSALSSHFFSTDGKDWRLISDTQPYGHTVHYEDGTHHTYTTLEQVSIHFDTMTVQKRPVLRHFILKNDHFTKTGSGQTNIGKVEKRGVFLQGQMTHMAFAADLVTQGGGCAQRPWRGGGPTACTNCKYNDHGGTVVIKLQTSPP